MRSESRRVSGVSIIELTAAISCLCVLIAAISTLCVSAARCSRQISEETVAVSAARGLLADIAACGAPEAPKEIALDVPAGSARVLNGAKAMAVFEPWTEDLSKVTVDLTWKDKRGAVRSIKLVSLVDAGGAR